MRIPFCECRSWSTPKDRATTLSEYLASANWEGRNLHITGSQPEDYTGASSLFNVEMTRELAEKFFGNSRVFSATLHNIDEINVLDQNHLIEWARKVGIKEADGLRARYGEYQRLFPKNCVKEISRVRISV